MIKQLIKTLFFIFAMAVLLSTCGGEGTSVSGTGQGGGSESEGLDSDGDGVPDYYEYQAGRDPNDPTDAPVDPEIEEYTNDPSLPDLDEVLSQEDLNSPGGQNLLAYLGLLAAGVGVKAVKSLIPSKTDACFKPTSAGNAISTDENELTATPFNGSKDATAEFKGGKFTLTEAGELPSKGAYFIAGVNIAMVPEPFKGCFNSFSLKVEAETCICNGPPPKTTLSPGTPEYITKFILSGINIKSGKVYSDTFTRPTKTACTQPESSSFRNTTSCVQQPSTDKKL